MKSLEMEYYRRNLPHWQIAGEEYFVTIRLANSLPAGVIKDIQRQRREFERTTQNKDKFRKVDKKQHEKRLFKKYEELLDNPKSGPQWLGLNNVAKIVKESLHYRDGVEFDLYAYCIMSNHIHIVFRHLNREVKSSDNLKLAPVTNILKSFKSFTGLHANRALQRKGAFWQEESFDRIIRDEKELENVIAYTLNNPVKVNLVSEWEKWPHSYCKKEFLESFK